MVLRAECEAYNCRNRTNNENNVYLHQIYSKQPSTNEKKRHNAEIRSRRWVTNLKRVDELSTKTPLICSEHFDIRCYVLKKDYVISKKLRNTAVPLTFHLIIFVKTLAIFFYLFR